MSARGRAGSIARTIWLLFQGLQELRLGLSGLDQMPEEPERESPALPTGPPAGPAPARTAAFMAHEAVKEADVEPVETQPAGRLPDRDVLGGADHFVNLPG